MSLTRRSGLAAELARRVIVRRRVAKPAAAITLLRDDGPRTLAGPEATAARCAVSVALAGARDELGPGSDGGRWRGRRRGGWGCGSLSTQLAGSVVVGLPVTKPAPSVTLLRDNRARALPALEAAAPGGAVGVALAWAGDELGAGGNGGRGGSGGRRACIGGGLATELTGSVIVRRGIAEAASTVALLSDDGTSALAGPEATTAGGTVDVAGARTGDKLRAGRSAGDVRRSSNCEEEAQGESEVHP